MDHNHPLLVWDLETSGIYVIYKPLSVQPDWTDCNSHGTRHKIGKHMGISSQYPAPRFPLALFTSLLKNIEIR